MSESKDFQPFIPAAEQPPEMTMRAVLLGAILGIIFGAASTYLALKVGLTVSASIPIAVISIALLRKSVNRRAILEHNIAQTVGSAGESVAGAIVFTVPALIFLGYALKPSLTALIALTGGLLGVLMMVPLRRYLIVKEHGVLRYPEGKACAEILIAGEKGGTSAKKVFVGMGIGALFQAFQKLFFGMKDAVSFPITLLKGASLDSIFEPPLLGVGYIIGYRTSLIMVAGSLLSSFVLIPMVFFFGSHANGALSPATGPISEMSTEDVWGFYIRYIGAGAVAAGGIFGLLRALPAIVSSLRASAKSLAGSGSVATSVLRTDRDTPTPILIGGSLFIVGAIWAIPQFQMNLVGAVLILILGFLFAVVSSRITGEIGSSSCPLSGMTIGVLMGTCGIFLLSGWSGDTYSKLALMVGAIVCVAISNAGTCSQDLKTGFLLGATPSRQQGAILIGVVTSVLAVAWVAYLLNLSEMKETPPKTAFTVSAAILGSPRGELDESRADGKSYRLLKLSREELPEGNPAGNYLVDAKSGEAKYLRVEGIGGDKYGAPQSRLMSVVIDGLLNRKLPWDLILLGVAIAIFIEILGFGSLTFAVGVYLPLSSTMPVFLGGLVRKFADKVYKRKPDDENESEGTLYCSGIIAGASLVGIATALVNFLPGYDDKKGLHPSFAFLRDLPTSKNEYFFLGVLALLCFLMFRAAADPKKR